MFSIFQWVIQMIGAVIMLLGGAVFAFGSLGIIGMAVVTIIFCFIWGGLDENRRLANKYRRGQKRRIIRFM